MASVCVCFKDNVCQFIDIPLTLKHMAIAFTKNTPTHQLYFGASISYKGELQPQLEPEEQRVLVVGNNLTFKP